MRNNIFISLAFIGLISLFPSCKKDETKATMLASPVAPELSTVPNLVLKRSEAAKKLQFVGTKADWGFASSVTYNLEAALAGSQFKTPILIATNKADTFNISVVDLNSVLIASLPVDVASAIELRVRAVLTVEASGAVPIVLISAAKAASVTTYGLARLDLIGSGITQKIESPLDNGKYAGFVKLDKTKAFTLKDPEANVVYGANGAALAVNGTGLSATASGWHKLSADTKGLTYTINPYMVAIVGSATPGGWDNDTKMDFDAASGTWKITLKLTDGEFKFRFNDAWGVNWGGTPDNLVYNGANLTITAGTYTISLKITNDTAGSNTGTCTIVKN